MASLLLLCFSLFLTLSTSTSTASAAVNATIDNQSPLSLLTLTPAPPPQTHVQKPPQQLQLNTIIDSIVGASDFNNWASMIAEVDPSIFPLTATLFIPDDAAFVTKNPPPYPPPSTTAVNFADPLLFTYHIIPRRYSYSELRRFPTGYRLPTLLPDNTLLITDNSAGNFTINGVLVTQPNLFQNAVVSVHGVGNILDHTQFGKTVPSPEKSPETVNTPLPLLEVSTSAVNMIKNICLLALLCMSFLGFLGIDLDIILVQALSACCLCAATVSRGFYLYMQDEFRFFLWWCLLCIVALISLLQSFDNWGFWP
ncbi:hypothetical protein BVRB_5g117890 [Beta vulgaris subsp. vulgaris]|nr:hypothetical protein BVRB_5g117890 [Beta vulgaris subsp. vulgaris]